MWVLQFGHKTVVLFSTSTLFFVPFSILCGDISRYDVNVIRRVSAFVLFLIIIYIMKKIS